MDGSDWGPAPNNVDRRSQLDEEEEDEEEKEKEKEEEKQEDEEEERKATDIKSNNPHLAGGEQQKCVVRPHAVPTSRPNCKFHSLTIMLYIYIYVI